MNIYNVIILDESGHMSAIYNQALTGINEVLSGKCVRTDYTDGDPELEADFYILRHTFSHLRAISEGTTNPLRTFQLA